MPRGRNTTAPRTSSAHITSAPSVAPLIAAFPPAGYAWTLYCISKALKIPTAKYPCSDVW